MITGHLPFHGDHEAAMIYLIVNEEPESLKNYVPDAQRELLHILDWALEKDREERYQTVHDMLIELRRLKKDSSRVSRQIHYDTPVPGTALPVPVVEGKKWGSKRLWVGVAGLALLCVITLLLLLLRTPATRLNPNRTSVAFRVPFKEISYPSLSGDGKWIVFPARGEDGKWDIYWMNTAGGKPSRLTDEAAYYIDGVDISPDVNQIVYDCRKEPNSVFCLKIASSQGGENRTLADTGWAPKWRADGSRVGYQRIGKSGVYPSPSGKYEIWSIRPDGTDNRLELIDTVTSGGAACAYCWSPDGGSIAWVRNYPEGYGEVMVRELAGGKEQQFTSDRKTVDEVIWAMNGAILFVSTRSGQSNLWMIPAGGGEAHQVTQGSAPILAARISADNRTLVYEQKERIAHLWISGIDGSNARQVTFDDACFSRAESSPDRKWIACVFSDVDVYNQEAHLYVLDRDGKNQRQLTSGSEIVRECAWSPDSKWLAYSSRSIEEPRDSSRVYLIRPFNPGAPRLLCKGEGPWWLGAERLLVCSQMKTLLCSTGGGAPTQVYKDSTYAIPLQGNDKLLFYDFRKGREGNWIVSIDSLGKQKGEPRRITPSDAIDGAITYDLRFWIFRKGDELWRIWTSTGKEERIGKKIPGEAWMQDVSMDGKEILWLKYYSPSKLVLVKDVFE